MNRKLVKMSGLLKYIFIAIVIFPAMMCRKPFDPPAIKAANHFLSVDGVINTGANSSSSFILSRSRSLTDSDINLPELGALVLIKTVAGISYPLIDITAKGVYSSDPLSLDASQKYQLSITTIDGNKYVSDLVTSKASAPIDSLNWKLMNDPALATDVVNVYANTHDPAGNSRYYRWDYIETWQHRSVYQSFWALDSNTYLEHGLFPSQTSYNCWSTGNSTSIIVGTSITLSADVISQARIATFIKDDLKMDVEYSMLVRQYPLDYLAYKYWLNVQTNSQTLGGLFDVQPAQLAGNIHGVTNPKDPVVGYVSACSIAELRLFINNNDLPGWKSNFGLNCPVKPGFPADPNNVLYWNNPDTSVQLYYYSGGQMEITFKECLDCRYQGGTLTQPLFWK